MLANPARGFTTQIGGQAIGSKSIYDTGRSSIFKQLRGARQVLAIESIALQPAVSDVFHRTKRKEKTGIITSGRSQRADLNSKAVSIYKLCRT